MSLLTELSQAMGGHRTVKGYYSKAFITEVVQSINEGMPRREAQQRYGVAVSTLSGWMQKYGTEAWRQQRKLPVPLSIKRKVVQALEQGQMTVREAQEAFNIKNGSTIRQWRKQWKQENAELVAANCSAMKDKITDHKAVTSTTPADVKALQKALEQAEMKIVALNTLIDVAERQLKINIRKKSGAKQ
jgi:transposase